MSVQAPRKRTREDFEREACEYEARHLRELAELPDEALRRFVAAVEAGQADDGEVAAWVRGPRDLHDVYSVRHIAAELARRGWPPLREAPAGRPFPP